VLQIYRDMRSRDLLEFIDRSMGKRPELDFDFGELWCTRRHVTLALSRGKVVAALFRNPGDARATGFLKGLDALKRREERRGLRALVAGFLLGGVSPEKHAEAMRDELKKLGVDLPAGIDPDQSDPKIFRAMNANVGSASFVVFDKEGKMAWYLPDPQTVDLGVAERVIDRLLKETPR
jgi:hypothetical protein